MRYYAVAFVCIAIAAALYGQSEVTTGAAFIGRFLFSVFLILALICSLLVRMERKSQSKPKIRR
jgi:uncharacterized membrane protein YtjA (UPF0391 family)